jgi:hypothetical protein
MNNAVNSALRDIVLGFLYQIVYITVCLCKTLFCPVDYTVYIWFNDKCVDSLRHDKLQNYPKKDLP